MSDERKDGSGIIKRIDIPADVKFIMKKLNDASYEAYLVGGAVRDSLMGNQIYDYDVTTSARPDEMLRVFDGMKVLDTGLKHGTLTVYANCEADKKTGGMWVEVTTFRVDGNYSDGRHPDSVCFSTSLREDLARRDFTVNAMAYSEESGLVDPFGGAEDIRQRKIRCVGDPQKRFTEDALRIMRAFRFSAKLGFGIDAETLNAAVKLKERLRLISAERIATEFSKTLKACSPVNTLNIMFDQGFFDIILPNSNITRQDIRYIENSVPSEEIRFSVLFRGKNKESVSRSLKDLKYSNHLINTVIRYSCTKLPAAEQGCGSVSVTSIRKFISACGGCAEATNLCLVALARNETLSDGRSMNDLIEIIKEIENNGDPLSPGDLAVNGRDLISEGIPAGRDIGRIMDLLFTEVLEDPSLNKREILLQKAMYFYNNNNFTAE